METKAGRPKGSVNKATAEVREKFRELVEGNISNFQDDLDSLKPIDRLNVIIQLAKFVLPTLRATELKTDSETKPVKIVFTKVEH